MDEMQLRFLTTQALYGKELQERSGAVRQLQQARLSAADVAAIGIRLELALECQDEYVRSAAAILLAGLSQQLPASPAITAALLDLSHSPEAFTREAALRAIALLSEHGFGLSTQDAAALTARLDEARRVEGEGFALSLFGDAEFL
jgi:hypothetical protein